MLCEKFLEIISCHAYVHVIVYLYGYTNAVAFANAKATCKNNLVGLNFVFRKGAFKKLNYILRALEMTGRANANLNYEHSLYPCKNFVLEEFLYGVGANRVNGILDGYAHALLAHAHAEGAAKLNLFSKVVFRNEILKLLYHLARALDVTGASDTYCYFKHIFYLTMFIVKS